jgi:hypothetical protein
MARVHTLMMAPLYLIIGLSPRILDSPPTAGLSGYGKLTVRIGWKRVDRVLSTLRLSISRVNGEIEKKTRLVGKG